MSKTRVITPKFRVSFPQIFEPAAITEGADLKYSISMIFDKDTDIKELKAACKQAIIDKWGENKNKWPSDLKTPFRKGSEKDLDGYDDDSIFARAASNQRPGVLNEYKEPMADASELYAGCYARASVSAYAYDTAGNRGVTFGLNNILKVADGDRLDSHVSAEDDFADIEVAAKPKKEVAKKPNKKSEEVKEDAGDTDDRLFENTNTNTNWLDED